MSDLPTYDPRRALAAHKAQERGAWDRYAAAVLAEVNDAALAAKEADAMLAERRRRFPGPRIRLEEEQ
jgi:hypothetical protein